MVLPIKAPIKKRPVSNIATETVLAEAPSTCQCVLLPVCSNWQSAVSHGGLASEGIVNSSNENIKYVKSAKAGEFMNPIFAMKVIMLSHPCLPSPALSGGSINPAIWCLYSNAFSTSCRDPSLARGCSHSVVNVFGPYLPFKKIPYSYNACSKNCLIELIFELLKPKLSNTFFIKHMVFGTRHKSSRHYADAILWLSPWSADTAAVRGQTAAPPRLHTLLTHYNCWAITFSSTSQTFN